MLSFTDLPEWAADRIYVDNEIHFGWPDRLRILVFGQCEVRSQTNVQYAPGRCESMSTVRFPRIRWPWRKRMEFGVAEAPR